MKETRIEIPPCPECGHARSIESMIAMSSFDVVCLHRFCNNTERERFSFAFAVADRAVPEPRRPIDDEVFGNLPGHSWSGKSNQEVIEATHAAYKLRRSMDREAV